MIKCEVIEAFTLGKFNELSNIARKGEDTPGKLNVGDTFECDEEMAKYLTGGNSKDKVVVKVLEVTPKKNEIQNLPHDNGEEFIVPKTKENNNIITNGIFKEIKKTNRTKRTKK